MHETKSADEGSSLESDDSSIARKTSATDRPWQTEETLRHHYLERGLTQAEVADELGCTQKTIHRWLKRHDIPITDQRGNSKRAPQAAKFRSYPSGGSYRYYEMWTNQGQFVRVHRLLAVAMYGFDAVRGMDVHHKNNIPWDNRPGNLELKDHSEHSSEHTKNQPRSENGALGKKAQLRTDGGRSTTTEESTATLPTRREADR